MTNTTVYHPHKYERRADGVLESGTAYSLHLLVLQLISLTSVHSKNAFSTFCDSSTLFLCTVTRTEVSSAYLVRSLS